MLGINLIPKEASIDLWKQEFREAIKNSSDLEKILKVKLPQTNYPIFITQRIARNIFKGGQLGPLWKQFVPRDEEKNLGGMEDPIGDHAHAKPGKIIHRYKNRLLFFPTPVCPINCRYCFRKNELAQPDSLFEGQLKDTVDYLTEHPEVNEVILSGGDPLVLDNSKLENIFQAFSQVTSVKYLRLHSRTPIVLPSRVTKGLTDLFSKYNKSFQSLLLAIHTNHSDELDEDARLALKRLKSSGIELLSQTVLLKDVNDDTKTLKELFINLIDLGIRPYYLHHPDRVKGAMHFYLSLTEGRMLYHSLRNELPGWMLPQYVIDIPGGEGKVPAFNPESFDFSGTLINKNSESVTVPPLFNN